MRYLLLIMAIWLTLPTVQAEEDDAWLIGRWALSYDPDGATTDYLIFRANGDLISISEHGEYHGFYLVVPGAVKGVLTKDGQDLLLTFFYNEARTELRIVTSDSGIESVYSKVGPE